LIRDESGRLLILYDPEIRYVGLISGDNNLVLREGFGNLLVHLQRGNFTGLDIEDGLDAVIMQAQALDGNKILALGNGGDGYGSVCVGVEHLVNDAGAGMVETIENDQNRVLSIDNDVAMELDLKISQGSLFGGIVPLIGAGRKSQDRDED
jgi:hypothetical protein